MNTYELNHKREKAMKELEKLQNTTYKLENYTKYMQDLKRMEYLSGQISLYDSILVDLQK
jgi:hypothetical protein